MRQVLDSVCGRLMRAILSGPEMHRAGVPNKVNQFVLLQQNTMVGVAYTVHICFLWLRLGSSKPRPWGTECQAMAWFLLSVLRGQKREPRRLPKIPVQRYSPLHESFGSLVPS